MVQSDEDNLDSSDTTASISYISTSSASSRAQPRTSLFLENLHDANDDLNAEQLALATVSYENTSRGEGFTVYINNERYSRIMSASTSSSSSSKSSSIVQFRDSQDNNIPTNTVDPAWLRRVNKEASFTYKKRNTFTNRGSTTGKGADFTFFTKIKLRIDNINFSTYGGRY